MKIKNLFSMLAMAGMLFATSCSQDEAIGGGAAGDFVDATFEIATTDAIGTRTIGDGETVDVVACAVYDADGEELRDLYIPNLPITDKKATYSVRLGKGRAYRVAFFAYNEAAAAYNVKYLHDIKVNDNQYCNAEGRDAFTAYVDVDATVNAIKETVTLNRPFAQLNLGIDATELADAAKAGIVVAKSKIVVSNVYRTFNAYNQEASNADEMTFDFGNVTDETLTVDGKEYTYLALNYLLVGADKENKSDLTNVEFYWQNEDGEGNNPATEFANIPVQRNYRTNIIGKLLTSPADFEIVIEEEFDEPDTDLDKVFNVDDLQAALDAAPAGKLTVINLGADIVGDVVDVQQPKRKVKIEGNGYRYNGTIKVHSNSNHYNDAALIIEGVTFETSTPGENFIEALENGSERYSCNITVENCTFTATGEAVNTAVGVQIKASKNAKVSKCTATNMHSLIQAQSCDESVTVKECTVNGKNGVAFKQVKNAVVEDNTINAVAYGIRFDGNTDNYAITIKGNNVTAAQPFIVRKMTGANNTITLQDENTLTVSAASIATEAPAYQIVITNGSDDESYVKPTGTYTLTGAEDYLVYPRDVFVASWDEFAAALADGAGIILTEDITYNANYQLQKSVSINLNGKSMTLPMLNIHTKTTVKNGTINGKVYARTGCNVTLDGLTFSGAISDNLSTEGHLAIKSGCQLYVKNCLFSPTSVSGTQTKPISFEGGTSTMKFENCEFKSSPYKKQIYFNSLSATATLEFANCNFNNKTPNIMFAAAAPLTNLKMSGTTKLSSVTLETNRAKEAITADEFDYLRNNIIANNSFSSVRLFYVGSSEYIYK